MKKFKTEFLILIFLWINVIYSLIINPWFGLNFLLGVFGLAIVTTLYFARKSANILILLFLLGIGTINIVSFNEAFSFEFYFFNMINILLFTILFYKKRKFLSALNEKWFGTPKEELLEIRKSEIESFKRRFAINRRFLIIESHLLCL